MYIPIFTSYVDCLDPEIESGPFTRGVHYIMNFAGRFSKVKFFNPNSETDFDFLITRKSLDAQAWSSRPAQQKRAPLPFTLGLEKLWLGPKGYPGGNKASI